MTTYDSSADPDGQDVPLLEEPGNEDSGIAVARAHPPAAYDDESEVDLVGDRPSESLPAEEAAIHLE